MATIHKIRTARLEGNSRKDPDFIPYSARRNINMPYVVTQAEQHAGNAVCNADLDKAVPSFFRGEITTEAAATLVHDILQAAGEARMASPGPK